MAAYSLLFGKLYLEGEGFGKLFFDDCVPAADEKYYIQNNANNISSVIRVDTGDRFPPSSRRGISLYPNTTLNINKCSDDVYLTIYESSFVEAVSSRGSFSNDFDLFEVWTINFVKKLK